MACNRTFGHRSFRGSCARGAAQEHHPESAVLPEERVQTDVDQALTKIAPQENSSSQMGTATSTPAPVPAHTPETNRHDVPANAGSWTLAHHRAPGRVLEPMGPRARSTSSLRTRIVDVKRRLIALWRKSLLRSERSRSWSLSANSNKWDRKKVSYTAEINH
jgi:hypothetical protein